MTARNAGIHRIFMVNVPPTPQPRRVLDVSASLSIFIRDSLLPAVLLSVGAGSNCHNEAGNDDIIFENIIVCPEFIVLNKANTGRQTDSG
jgi:hypothetical protein